MGERSRVSFGARRVSFGSANGLSPACVGGGFLEAKTDSGKIGLQRHRQHFLLAGFLCPGVSGKEVRGGVSYHPSEYRGGSPSEQGQGRARLLSGLVLRQPAG